MATALEIYFSLLLMNQKASLLKILLEVSGWVVDKK